MSNSAPTTPRRPTRDDFSGDYGQDLDNLLGIIGDGQEALIGATTGLVTPYFRADLYTHAIEKRIRSPLPLGMKCTGVATVSALGVTIGTDGRPTSATYALQVAGNPSWRSMGATKDGGEVIGITVQYAQYERGTWTPTLGTFSSGSVTYSNQIGTFTRNGALVTAFWRVQLSGISAPVSTGLGLIGMPYSIANSGAGAIGFSTGMTGVTGYITHRFDSGGSNNLAIHNNGNFTGELLGSNLTASSQIFGAFSYLTADPATTGRVTLMFFGE